MKNRNKGFTLIEILVVMTILIALTLFGLTKYMNIVEENKMKIDIANARNIAEAVSINIAMGEIYPEGTELTTSDLKNLIDEKMAPISKTFKTINESFTARITSDGVIVLVGTTEIYPTYQASGENSN